MASIWKRGTKRGGTFTPWLDRNGRARWEAQVYAGRHPTTHRPQFVRRSFLRRSDAQAWAEEQQGLKRTNLRPVTTRETFAQYLAGWLQTYATQVGSTYNYEKTLGKWVVNPQLRGLPHIGAKRLRDLEVGDFNRLYVFMARQGVTRAVGYLHGILKRALNAAVREGTLPRNPAAFATVPKVQPKGEIITEADEDEAGSVLRSLSQEQASNFLEAARDPREQRYTALWYVLLTGWLRPGEAVALKWRHVDFEKGEVNVRATLTRLGLRGGWKLKEPKTENSRREVPLPPVTMQELRAWKKRQNEERLRAGAEWQDHGFVFTTRLGEPLGAAKQIHNSFRRVCERAKVPGTYGPEPAKPVHGPTAQRPFTPAFRVYDLRHTGITLALLNGEDLLKVSRRAGHKSPMFTAERYGHVKAADTRSTADIMERLFAHN